MFDKKDFDQGDFLEIAEEDTPKAVSTPSSKNIEKPNQAKPLEVKQEQPEAQKVELPKVEEQILEKPSNNNVKKVVNKKVIKPHNTNNANALSIVCIVLAVIFTIGFIVGLIILTSLDTNLGNYVLLFVGIFALVACVILTIVYLAKFSGGCKKCHGKVSKSYYFVGSSKTIKVFNKSKNNAQNYKLFKITHHYEEISVCKSCHEKSIRKFIGDGGSVIKYYNGRVIDHRIKPKYKLKEELKDEK